MPTLDDRITEVTRIPTEWPEADRLAGVLRVIRAMGEDVESHRYCATLLGAAQHAIADMMVHRDDYAKRLALAENVVEAARRVYATKHNCVVIDKWSEMDDVENAVSAYDAAKERAVSARKDEDATPSGEVRTPRPSPEPHIVHFEGKMESATMDLGPAVRQYSATCKHALWMEGSCPECHQTPRDDGLKTVLVCLRPGEHVEVHRGPSQYQGPIGPPHPSEGPRDDPENDYVAGPLAEQMKRRSK